ncbi:MAG: hypothetical protein Q9218_007230, partial [Villophora microphyllina]
MATNNVYTTFSGDNIGGLTAGQANILGDVNFTGGEHWEGLWHRGELTWLADPGSQRRKILSWFCPLQFWQKHENVFSELHTRTGQWFLDSTGFRAWRGGTPARLWWYGPPGAGQTVLASLVVNRLRQDFAKDETVGVAVAFCEWTSRQNAPSLMTPLNLLASVWFQLLGKKPLPEEMNSLYHRHTLGTEIKVEEVSLILDREIEGFKGVYVVIDAVDELSEDHGYATVLVGALAKLSQSSPAKIHLLVTSRSQDCLFENSAILQATATKDDIEIYVAYTISQGLCTSRQLPTAVKEDTTLTQRLVNVISVKS